MSYLYGFSTQIILQTFQKVHMYPKKTKKKPGKTITTYEQLLAKWIKYFRF